jgi:putative endonuclease
VTAAISREKQIKGWLRSKKIALIETENPNWSDLSVDWFGKGTHSSVNLSKDLLQNDKIK